MTYELKEGEGYCPVCDVPFKITLAGYIAVHGPRGNRCEGGVPTRFIPKSSREYEYMKYEPSSYDTNLKGKTCNVCKELKLIRNFSRNGKTKDGLSNVCKVCARIRKENYAENDLRKLRLKREAVNRVRQHKKTVIQQIKVERGCADCGWNEHPIALDFDHLPGHEKVESVGYLLASNKSLEILLAEIDKCDVVCARCHRMRTFNRQQGANNESDEL